MNRKTIVVIHSVGPMMLKSTLAQEIVIAIVWAGLPAQDSGNALVHVLNELFFPSGKHPLTVARRESVYPSTTVRADDDYSEVLLLIMGL